jgi:hypothetical protein
MSPERTAMSEKKNWRPMVEVGRDWAGNSLVFATKEEAEANARWLMSRWISVTDTRADPTDKPVNYRWIHNKMIRVEQEVKQ